MRESTITTLPGKKLQCGSAEVHTRSKINAGKARVLSFTVHYQQENRHPLEVDVVPFWVRSEAELVEFAKQIEMKYNAEPGAVSIVAELIATDSDSNIEKVVYSVGAKEKFEYVTYTEEGEISLTELILQKGAGEAIELIDERLFGLGNIEVNESQTGADTKWFMPNYRIFIEAYEDQEDFKKEIEKGMAEEFEVLEVEHAVDGMYFYCYAGEGPIVDSVNDVLWVISERFRPHIIGLLEQMGITGYWIEFHIDELHM